MDTTEGQGGVCRELNSHITLDFVPLKLLVKEEVLLDPLVGKGFRDREVDPSRPTKAKAPCHHPKGSFLGHLETDGDHLDPKTRERVGSRVEPENLDPGDGEGLYKEETTLLGSTF